MANALLYGFMQLKDLAPREPSRSIPTCSSARSR
jgi:hypothetical protein